MKKFLAALIIFNAVSAMRYSRLTKGHLNDRYSVAIKDCTFEIYDTIAQETIYLATTQFPLLLIDFTVLPGDIIAHLDLAFENSVMITTFVDLEKKEIIGSLRGKRPKYLKNPSRVELEISHNKRVQFIYPIVEGVLAMGNAKRDTPMKRIKPVPLPVPLDPVEDVQRNPRRKLNKILNTYHETKSAAKAIFK